MTVLLSLLGSGKFWACLGVIALLSWAGVQTARLDHAKHDLANARAALVDPKTKATWETEAVSASADRDSYKISLDSANAALATQEADVKALKAESDTRSAQAAANLAAAHAADASDQKRIAALMAAKDGPDSCASGDSLLQENAQ
jgi:hypothetical protein